VLWYPLRLLEEAGLAGLWTTVAMFVAALVVAGFLWRPSLQEMSSHWRLLLIIGLGSGWCNTAFILGVLQGEVVRVLLLFYMSPVWGVLLAWMFLREPIYRTDFLVLSVALLGGLVVLWEPGMKFPIPSSAGDWLGLTAGMGFAVGNVAVRKGDALALGPKMTANWLGVFALSLAGAAITATPFPQVSMQIWAAALLLGGLGITVMTGIVFYGITRMPVKRSMVILLVEIFAGAASAHWLAGEVPGVREWMGGALILLATIMAAGATTKKVEAVA
jgi:drug/metabolite transporter (DMT)-like permease